MQPTSLTGRSVPATAYSAFVSSVLVTRADAIHLAHGFLTENTQFSETCKLSGINFVEPLADRITKMGDKATGNEPMIATGVPGEPNSPGLVESAEDASKLAV